MLKHPIHRELERLVLGQVVYARPVLLEDVIELPVQALPVLDGTLLILNIQLT